MDEFADDFAFLSYDIIYDVLQFAHFAQRLSGKSSCTVPNGGRWGEIAKKFSYFKLEDNKIVECRLDGNSTWFVSAAKNRKDVAVNSLCLSENSDFNEIKHLAANAYESLEVCYKVVLKEFLDNLGTRFTKIIWSDKKKTNGGIYFSKQITTTNMGFTPGQLVRLQQAFPMTRFPSSSKCAKIASELGIPKIRIWNWFIDRRAKLLEQERALTNRNEQIRQGNPSWIVVNREIDFLTRQLKSPHLRILESDSPVLARPEFTDLLVHFVRKKNFQTLKSKSSECLSPKVFMAAYEAWLQRSEREHLLSSITAPISTEDLRKLTAIYARDKHPTANHYETIMTCQERCNGTHELTMEFSRDIIKY